VRFKDFTDYLEFDADPPSTSCRLCHRPGHQRQFTLADGNDYSLFVVGNGVPGSRLWALSTTPTP
jgi:hypothetical protein